MKKYFIIVLLLMAGNIQAFQATNAQFTNTRINPLQPDQLTGLILWLDAADSTTFTKDATGNISQWDDKSGNGNHATQNVAAEQPLYTASYLDSKAVVAFDGIDDWFGITQLVNPYTIITVSNLNTNSPPGYFWDMRNDIANSWIYSASIGPIWEPNFYLNNSSVDNNPGAIFNSTWQVNHFEASASGTAFMHFGERYLDLAGDPQSVSGYVAEFIIYNRILTAAERTTIYDYLRRKWRF